MDITVVLCTYNRCAILPKALDSVASSILPSSVEWEVLVIDNNSSDQTRQVVEDISSRHPGRFRYVFEPRQGKSHALNTAIRQALGGVLAFLDDDVTVEPTWLDNLTSPLRSGEWAAAGGRTLPAERFSPPRWLALDGPYSMAGMLYAHFDLGDAPGSLDRAPYGANMACRKAMFDKYGGFRLDLGPGPDSDIPRFNEDTEFGRRLLAAGERLRYEPSAVAYHVVPRDRVRKQYFLDWWYDFGRSSIREGGKRPDILGLPRYYFSIPNLMVGTLLRALRWSVAFDPHRRFFLKAWTWCFAGQLVEVCRWSRKQT